MSSSIINSYRFTIPTPNPFVVADGTQIFNDPILRGSPNVAGQYFDSNNTELFGLTISTVRVYMAKTGSPGGTITCRVGNVVPGYTTIGTQPTSAVTGSPTTGGGSLVSFSGSTAVIPSGEFNIEFVLTGYTGTPPVDYIYMGHNTGDVFPNGYATQSGSQSGTGKDLCLNFDWS